MYQGEGTPIEELPWLDWSMGIFLIANWYRREVLPLGMPVKDYLAQLRLEDSLYRYTVLFPVMVTFLLLGQNQGNV